MQQITEITIQLLAAAPLAMQVITTARLAVVIVETGSLLILTEATMGIVATDMAALIDQGTDPIMALIVLLYTIGITPVGVMDTCPGAIRITAPYHLPTLI